MGQEEGRLQAGLQDTAPLCQPYSWGHAPHYLFSWKWAKANSRSREGHAFSCSLGGHAAQQCAVPGSISGRKVEPSSTFLWRSWTHFFLRKDRLCKEESPFQQHCASFSEGGEEQEKEATRGLRHLVTTTFDPGMSICLLLMQLCGEATFSQNQLMDCW